MAIQDLHNFRDSGDIEKLNKEITKRCGLFKINKWASGLDAGTAPCYCLVATRPRFFETPPARAIVSDLKGDGGNDAREKYCVNFYCLFWTEKGKN